MFLNLLVGLLILWVMFIISIKIISWILSKQNIDFVLETSAWKFRVDHFCLRIKNLKDNFLNSFSIKLRNLRPKIRSLMNLEIMVDFIEIEVQLIYLDLNIIEDINDWKKNAQKFYLNCQIIRGRQLVLFF
jgi:predicted metalloenzyme YecM